MRYLIIVALMCLSQLEALSANNKVLVISSYGTDYQWSNIIMDGISQEMKKVYPSIEFSREFLSSEFLGEIDTWGEKVSILLRNYRKNPPMAIVLISDEAWMAYQDANVTDFKDIPLILCAVKPHSIRTHEFSKNINSLSLSHFTPTTEVMKKYNATGVLRQMNTPGYLSLMRSLIKDLDHFVFITDKRFYGVYTRLLLEQEINQYCPEIPVEYVDARFVTTDSLLSRLPHFTPSTGILLTSWLTGEYGFEHSKDYLYSQMESKLSTPIFITNNIGLEKEYFVGGYFNEASFWGKKASDMLIDILHGKSPKDIKPSVYHDDECYIAWKVFEHYGLNHSKLPAKVRYYNRPEPFLITYKYYIIGASILLFIFIAFYLYTLRSNFKLHSAQRLLLKSIDETKTANIELEKTHKHLTSALRKAEESDQLKSAFIANMSHEIRTPLNAIVGFSGVIVDLDSKEERAEFAELIQRNSDLLLQLLSDILDVSRIESGTFDMTYEQVDALDICTNVVASLQEKCKPGVTLSLHDSLVSMSIHSDPNRLIQVLTNLVNNAAKFTSTGGIKVGYFSYDDRLIEFFVKDTGIGIPEDKLSSIFGRFVKLNSYIEGTGLGLPICKTIVEMLGGEIGVDSKEGVGARFWFRIPKQ